MAEETAPRPTIEILLTEMEARGLGITMDYLSATGLWEVTWARHEGYYSAAGRDLVRVLQCICEQAARTYGGRYFGEPLPARVSALQASEPGMGAPTAIRRLTPEGGGGAVSIDAKIRRIERDGDDLVMHLEPRWDARVHRWSLTGQDRLRVKQPTWEPPASAIVWGNSGTVVVVSPDGSERLYERTTITTLREARP